MRINVLLLDDDEALLPYYKAVIHPIVGIGRVGFAKNEKEFERELAEYPPHVVLSDIHMEPKEGPDILLSYKKQLENVNVVLLSCADEIDAVRVDLIKAGINVVGQLFKPLKPNELYDIFGYGID